MKKQFGWKAGDSKGILKIEGTPQEIKDFEKRLKKQNKKKNEKRREWYLKDKEKRMDLCRCGNKKLKTAKRCRECFCKGKNKGGNRWWA